MRQSKHPACIIGHDNGHAISRQYPEHLARLGCDKSIGLKIGRFINLGRIQHSSAVHLPNPNRRTWQALGQLLAVDLNVGRIVTNMVA